MQTVFFSVPGSYSKVYHPISITAPDVLLCGRMRDTGGRESEDFFKTEEEWDRKRRS